MEKIDHLLAAQFKQKKDLARQEYLANVRFKLVVLDLVETYVKTQSDNVNIFELCMPMLQAATQTVSDKSKAELFIRLSAMLKSK
jgi:hypothetical protein